MKKLLLALMAVAAISLVGCKPKNTPEEPTKTTYAYAEYTITTNATEALASVADLRIVYTDENGQQAEKIVSAKSATISVKTTGPVESISIEAYTAKKADADFTETNPYAYKLEGYDMMVMDLGMGFSGVLTTFDNKGNPIKPVKIEASSPTYRQTQLFGVETVIDIMAKSPLARVSFKFDSEGHLEGHSVTE